MTRKNKISVYGSTGFIGNEFCKMFTGETIGIEREIRKPSSSNILYLISTTHNYNIFDKPLLDIDTNLRILIEALEACRLAEDPDLVFNFVSSWFVYGKTEDFPATEETHCNPKGFYSITKRAAEQLLISYCETYKIKYRILRLCNVYGSSDQKFSKKRNAMQHLISEVVKGNDINLYNGGEDVRDFMHVTDVVQALKTCCDLGRTNEIFNIGTGIPTKFIDIMNYVKIKTNSKSVINSIAPPEFHKVVQIDKMYLDNSKIISLGFKAKTQLYRAIDDLIDDLQEEIK